MPVLLDPPLSNQAAVTGSHKACLDIGLLNNLPDGGMERGERQFIGLLDAAAGDRVVKLKLLSLPTVPRSTAARARIAARYTHLPSLKEGRLDGLIVTGCEPSSARLSDEPYWRSLTDMVDWAEHHTVSTIWSCLAAHAAVLHLDGIERQPLAQKQSGVFPFERADEHILLAGLPGRLEVPHSRWNALVEADLTAHGYKVLTRSDRDGVDCFVKQWRSLFVYFQGHPEYDAMALAREYRRDVARFTSGLGGSYPAYPKHYFSNATETTLDAARRGAEPLAHDFTTSDLRPPVWPADSVAVMRNWLAYLAAQRS